MEKKYTARDLLRLRIFRTMTKEKLAQVIDSEMHYEEYKKLMPNDGYSEDKAENLIATWNKQ